jgi:hypothetical protein
MCPSSTARPAGVPGGSSQQPQAIATDTTTVTLGVRATTGRPRTDSQGWLAGCCKHLSRSRRAGRAAEDYSRYRGESKHPTRTTGLRIRSAWPPDKPGRSRISAPLDFALRRCYCCCCCLVCRPRLPLVAAARETPRHHLCHRCCSQESPRSQGGAPLQSQGSCR